jgi:hypothetical protein
MDITRNWRLKTSRSKLLATRCPESGAVLLPQQTGTTNGATRVYMFDVETATAPQAEVDYAQAAR